MYRFMILGIALVGVFSLSDNFDLVPQTATAVEAELGNVMPDEIVWQNLPAAPPVTAAAYAVIDVSTGHVLLESAATTPRPIASVTKLFTAAAVVAESPVSLQLTATDIATEGRAGKLATGDTYTTYELLYPLLLESSNDAASAIARAVEVRAGSAGVSLADASGLSDQNVASALAVAMATRELFIAHPHIFDITRLSQYVGESNGWVNNSPVRDLPGYLGGKHGYTTAANRTLAAVFSEPALSNRPIAYVLLGSDDLRADTLALRQAVAEAVSTK